MSAAAISSGVAGDHGRDPEPLEGDPDRADIAAAEIDDGELHSTPLVLGSASLALARHRLAKRPAERLEAGFGLVMVVLALDPDMDRRAEAVGEERKTWRVISVG